MRKINFKEITIPAVLLFTAHAMAQSNLPAQVQELDAMANAMAPLHARLEACNAAQREMTPLSTKVRGKPVTPGALQMMDFLHNRTNAKKPEKTDADENTIIASASKVVPLISTCSDAANEVTRLFGPNPHDFFVKKTKTMDLATAAKDPKMTAVLVKFGENQEKLFQGLNNFGAMQTLVDGDVNLKQLFGTHAHQIIKK